MPEILTFNLPEYRTCIFYCFFSIGKAIGGGGGRGVCVEVSPRTACSCQKFKARDHGSGSIAYAHMRSTGARSTVFVGHDPCHTR